MNSTLVGYENILMKFGPWISNSNIPYLWRGFIFYFRNYSSSVSGTHHYVQKKTYKVCTHLHANPLARNPGQVKIMKEFVW